MAAECMVSAEGAGGYGAGWQRRTADHEPLAEIEGAVEHPQPEQAAQRGDRMVAQPPRGTDSRRHGVRPLSPRHRAARQGLADAGGYGASGGIGRTPRRRAHASRSHRAGDGGAVHPTCQGYRSG